MQLRLICYVLDGVGPYCPGTSLGHERARPGFVARNEHISPVDNRLVVTRSMDRLRHCAQLDWDFLLGARRGHSRVREVYSIVHLKLESGEIFD